MNWSGKRELGSGFRTVSGPMAIVTWLVAVGWLALAVGSFVALGSPWSVLVGSFAVLGAAATGWVAQGMRVRYNAARLVLPGRGETDWSEVARIELQGRALVVPVVGLRAGRGIEEVPLDGLAWFGARGTPRRLAEQLATAGGVGQVSRRERPAGGGRGRRAID